jgi:hypothetical protein
VKKEEMAMLTMKPGQKLFDKRSNSVYIIQNIKQGHVHLVNEDDEMGMLLDEDSVALSGFEAVNDQKSTTFDSRVTILTRHDQTGPEKRSLAHFLKKARAFWRTTVRSLADV